MLVDAAVRERATSDFESVSNELAIGD